MSASIVRLPRSPESPFDLDALPTADGLLEAEQALLGLALYDPARYLPDLEARHFREPVHRRLWEEIGFLVSGEFQAAVTGPALASTLVSRMREDLGLRALGGPRYIALLVDKAPDGADTTALAREVHTLSLQRVSKAMLEGMEDGHLGHTPESLALLDAEIARIEALWSPTGRKLKLIDSAAWQDVEPPRREWWWSEYVPHGQATLLTGAGSSGKSLLGQQLCTSTALGRAFLGVETRPGVALYVTCEDDAAELHRRQDNICYAMQAQPSDLADRLHLVTLMGEPGNELCTFDRDGRMHTTPAWARLRATVLELNAGLVVLDNVAHLFGGNEIIRAQVAAFCNLLNGLAAEGEGRAVVFIGHPNKAGTAYSGSTAWENQVRSRLFLARSAEDGDPDVRVLTRDKANYAQKGGAIEFRWWRWAFIRDADLPAEEGATLAAQLMSTGDDRAFLACLAKATEEGRATSSSRNASNFAPKVFAGMELAAGVTRQRFEAAMERLLGAGEIVDKVEVFRNARRQIVMGLAPAQRSAQTPAHRLAQGRSEVSDEA